MHEFNKVFRDKRGGQHYHEFGFAGIHYRLTGRFGLVKKSKTIPNGTYIVSEAESFDGKITWSTENGDFYTNDKVFNIWREPFPNPGKSGLTQEL